MAAADYLLCTNCGSKTIYDADIDYDTPNLGQIAALCARCTGSGHKLVFFDPPHDFRTIPTDRPTRDEYAQTLYETFWPGCSLPDALPEVRDNFYRLAETAASALNTTLEER